MNKNFLFFFGFLCVFLLPITSEAAFFENNTNLLFLEKFFFKKQKYLLFLIFFLPSIYFINKKNYLLCCFFLFFQIFTILYWSSLIQWIRDLAGDSLSEINTLNIYFIFSWLNSIFNFLKPNLELGSFFKFYLFGFMIYFLTKSFIKNRRNYLINLPIILSFFFIILFIKAIIYVYF